MYTKNILQTQLSKLNSMYKQHKNLKKLKNPDERPPHSIGARFLGYACQKYANSYPYKTRKMQDYTYNCANYVLKVHKKLQIDLESHPFLS